MWTEFATSAGGRIVSDNKALVLTHPNSDRYSITGTDQEFNLEIRNVSAGDGGTYLCQDINASPPLRYRGYAELIVLESDPVCTDFVPTPSGVVVEGFTYATECEVRYRGNIAPIVTITGPGTFFSNGTSPVGSVWSYTRFIADRSIDGGRFTFKTNFSSSLTSQPDHANNSPTYEHTFEGPVLVVSWGPKNMSATPLKTAYVAGDVITCNSDAKPDPVYVWTNMRTLVEEAPGQTFTITPALEGFEQVMRCNAQNVILGSTFSQDLFIDAFVPAVTSPTIPGSTTPTTPPPADAPCNDLTGRWSSTNPNAVICIEMDSKGNLATLLRNGSDPYFVPGNGKTVYGDYKHIGFSGVWPSGLGVAGFSGECHKCSGTEVILLSGLSRNKENSPGCGLSAGTELTKLYILTRSGPPCRGLELDVSKNTKPDHLKIMGVRARTAGVLA
jgi:hypothetical protein